MNARFASDCKACGERIGEGEEIAKGALGYVHPRCTMVAQPAARRQAPRQEGADASGLRDGIFTIGLPDGERRTIKVGTDEEQGKTFVSLLTGSDNERSYTCVGLAVGGTFRWTRRFAAERNDALTAAVAFLLSAGDDRLHEFGIAYALESGNCYVCNRTLTTPESIAASIGPVCAAARGVAA